MSEKDYGDKTFRVVLAIEGNGTGHVKHAIDYVPFDTCVNYAEHMVASSRALAGVPDPAAFVQQVQNLCLSVSAVTGGSSCCCVPPAHRCLQCQATALLELLPKENDDE